MDTNVQALKGLYTALGGEAADVENLTTSSEVITALEAVAAAAATELPAVKASDAGKNLTVNSSGKWAAIMPEDELPEVTTSDNGKVLTVFNGEWDKRYISTNLVVTINEVSGNFVIVYSSDFSEILPYVKANGNVNFTFNGGIFGSGLQAQGGFFSGAGINSQPIYANGIFDTVDHGLCAYSIKITPDNTKTIKVEPITPTA